MKIYSSVFLLLWWLFTVIICWLFRNIFLLFLFFSFQFFPRFIGSDWYYFSYIFSIISLLIALRSMTGTLFQWCIFWQIPCHLDFTFFHVRLYSSIISIVLYVITSFSSPKPKPLQTLFNSLRLCYVCFYLHFSVHISWYRHNSQYMKDLYFMYSFLTG